MRPILAAALVIFATAPADAAFTICNKANLPAKVAFGHFDGKAWRSEGWWTILPQKCETVLYGALDARYYYVYGTDGGSGTWNGGTYFCTSSTGNFSIAGRANCAARHYDRHGFFTVDTGDATDWRQALSD
ncbi:MAG: DUF1036 domain-containing protein [Alphaproteobacteria bacterium]|nr:DUF1036 domain-containing protein [Alphaproteobacteria bacterium]